MFRDKICSGNFIITTAHTGDNELIGRYIGSFLFSSEKTYHLMVLHFVWWHGFLAQIYLFMLWTVIVRFNDTPLVENWHSNRLRWLWRGMFKIHNRYFWQVDDIHIILPSIFCVNLQRANAKSKGYLNITSIQLNHTITNDWQYLFTVLTILLVKMWKFKHV